MREKESGERERGEKENGKGREREERKRMGEEEREGEHITGRIMLPWQPVRPWKTNIYISEIDHQEMKIVKIRL